MTKGLLISRDNKEKLHKHAINNPVSENLNKYKSYRNIYNSLIRASKKLYFTSSLKNNEKKPRKTWDTLREIIGNNKSTNKIESITTNNTTLTDPTHIAEEFNSFFTNIGQSISSTINPTSLDPNDFVPPNPNPPDLDLGLTSPATVVETIKNFESKASLDINRLSTKLLKAIAIEISVPLSYVFNLSITQGIFPTKFKISRTVPIFKSGNSEQCDNYRPISLLSSLSKILEKHIDVQLTNHLELNELLYKHQYGFQRNRSTEQNLTHLTNYIYNALNYKKILYWTISRLKESL
jgi:hypothetical protein